jgi:hypothetical protein
MPEVSQDQLEAMQRTVRSVAQILKDPKRRVKLLELQKEAEPEAIIPELEIQKPVNEALQNVTKKIDDFIDAQRQDREKRDTEARLAEFTQKYEQGRAFLASHGYLPELIQKIEKFMEERGIANHEDALPAYERLYPPPAPIKSSGLSNFLNKAKGDDTDELTKQLIASRGDDNFVLDRMIDAVRRENT